MRTAGSTCPSCGAIVRPDADWCTLCFADMRPVPPPRLPPGAATGSSGVPAVPGSGSMSRSELVPCTVCQTPMPLTAASCPACGSGLLDGLRSSAVASLRVPVLGDLMRFSRGMRTTIALAISLLAVAIVLVPLGLIF